MGNLGGSNKSQPIAWGDVESWHIVENGPCYALWKGGVFISNCYRNDRDLKAKIAYVEKYHMKGVN